MKEIQKSKKSVDTVLIASFETLDPAIPESFVELKKIYLFTYFCRGREEQRERASPKQTHS